MSDKTVQLDDEQAAVAGAAADSRFLVIAGAGQGKTEVVTRRIDNLVRVDDLLPSEEILVLSFSRAAVHAVRTRLGQHDIAAPNVRTFDSFANLLLVEAGIEPAGSFNDRIRRATKLLHESGEPPYPVSEIRHLILDEVQDLVGDRADFVLEILRSLGREAGVTALGDPLQAVYDFQLDESMSRTTSANVFEALRDEFGCAEIRFSKNYRARRKPTKKVVKFGEELREIDGGELAARRLDVFKHELPDRGEIDEWAELLTPRGDDRTAVLCTTNAEVLRVSRYLMQKGIGHVVRRQSQDFGAARWIADVLGPLPGPKERRSVIEERIARLSGEEGSTDKWRQLKAAEGRTREFDSLDLRRIHRVVRAGALPLPLTEPDRSSVIVSTIHRAKGLEFENVFVVEPVSPPQDEDDWTRVRREYVALSRARDQVFLCQLPRPRSWIHADDRYDNRFKEEVVSRRKRGRRWTRAIEFRYDDVDVARPATTRERSAEEIQDALRTPGLVGSPVVVRLDEDESTDYSPSFVIETPDGLTLGRTSEEFNQAFVHYYHWLDQWPQLVDGLCLVSIETVAGDERLSERAGLGSNGFWLVPRLTGLARPVLSQREENE